MKTIIPSALLLFLLACNSNPKETADLSNSNTAPKNYATDSMAKWTRNGFDFFNTVGFIDKNNLKQGRWTSWENGKVIKTEIYKDGKLMEGC